MRLMSQTTLPILKVVVRWAVFYCTVKVIKLLKKKSVALGAVLTSILTFDIRLLFSNSHLVPTSSHISEVTVCVITHLSQPQFLSLSAYRCSFYCSCRHWRRWFPCSIPLFVFEDMMRPLVAGLRVKMIKLIAAKLKAAQSETGLGSRGFRFKSCNGSNTGKWAVLRCLRQRIKCPNASDHLLP